MENKELQKRYDALFELYVEHIHEHRLGAIPAMQCSGCIEMANAQIERLLTNRASDVAYCTCLHPGQLVDGVCPKCHLPYFIQKIK